MAEVMHIKLTDWPRDAPSPLCLHYFYNSVPEMHKSIEHVLSIISKEMMCQICI